jgi:hypothetical protein
MRNLSSSSRLSLCTKVESVTLLGRVMLGARVHIEVGVIGFTVYLVAQRALMSPLNIYKQEDKVAGCLCPSP